MKKVILSLTLLASPAKSDCLDTVLESLRHPNDPIFSLEQMQCLGNNPEAKEGLNILCSENLEDISAKYARYRFYEEKNKSLWSKFSSAQNSVDRNAILREINNNKILWSADGFRAEIDPALLSIMRAKHICSDE